MYNKLLCCFLKCSSSEEESESESGEFDDSTCPVGCDPALFDHVCEARERRLDMEELVGEERKQLEGMRRDLEALRKKAKTVESHVKTAQADLQVICIYAHALSHDMDEMWNPSSALCSLESTSIT